MVSTIDSLDLFLELVILIEVSQAEKKLIASLLHVLNYLKKKMILFQLHILLIEYY